jgi:hypothetical protein
MNHTRPEPDVIRHKQITATIIADSITPCGVRLTSVEAMIPTRVQSELNTHRAFSRNSESSRAISFAAQIAQVRTNPFIPARVYKESTRMFGRELVDDITLFEFQSDWRVRALEAAAAAELDYKRGIHRQTASMILAPFSWKRVIITSAEWDNFFNQRCAVDALPEINDLAWSIYAAMQHSTPAQLDIGDWHIPYDPTPEEAPNETSTALVHRQIVSVANCARVSYGNLGANKSMDEQLRLVWSLYNNKHLSPFEHIAHVGLDSSNRGVSRNFAPPWEQFRAFIELGAINLPAARTGV